MAKFISVIFLCAVLVSLALGQTNGTIRGSIQDESGAVIPGSKVTASGPRGMVKTATAGADGSYVFAGLPAGQYTVQAMSPGLNQFQPAKVDVGSNPVILNIKLRVSLETQQVTVAESTTPAVTTDPSTNAGQIVLKEEDLQALSDDPDDLAADLQALAGPSAGPNGGQIYIDGFTGGRLPPKESIREIRINSNPFSAEYDRLGFGRIEIFTKPGTDKFRGQAFFNISDGSLNSRNPYLTTAQAAPFQSRMYGGNFGGPLTKKSSFFLDFDRREIDDDGIINAQIVDPTSLQILPFSGYVPTPQRRMSMSPRIDYQLGKNNSLTARYTYTRNDLKDQGVGVQNLASRGVNQLNQEQTVQMTDTQVIGARAINETRFQFERSNNQGYGDNSIPSINVAQAFNGGGAQAGHNYTIGSSYELQNYTSYNQGRHALKFGVRVRANNLTTQSPNNFGGTFAFTNGYGPILDSNNQPIAAGVVCDPNNPSAGCQTLTSIERYRRTLTFLKQGLSPAQIRQLGGGAAQFTLNAGNPLLGISQTDLGFFVQDDFRFRPNLTVSMGLRYEYQTNINDLKDIAPRIGIAWAPGSSKNSRPKTVVRAGIGIFYDRFSENYTLQAQRFDGITQQSYVATNPDSYPNIPSLGSLQVKGSSITKVDQNLRAPYVIQSAFGVERQLPFATTVAVNYTNSRGLHLLRSRDINSPLPGTYTGAGTGVRPFGGTNEINLFESSGILKQNQLMINVRNQASRKISLFGGYFLNFAKSNTDGAGSFPANQYDVSGEYGRAAIDSRQRMILGGSVTTKWDIRFSPFIIANTGRPFNIYMSRDLYGNTILNTARPAFAANTTAPGVIVNQYGAFDPNPKPGETIIPRNYGEGPSYFSVNLRMSKTFGFGAERGGGRPAAGGDGGPMGAPGGGFGGGGGGPRGGGAHGGGGGHGGGGEGSTNHRYNMTLSVNARNLLNSNNQGPYIGDITSPLFGTSNRLAGGFGAEANPANNRRVEFGLRFSF